MRPNPHLRPELFRICQDGPGLFYLNYEAANPRYDRVSSQGTNPPEFFKVLREDFATRKRHDRDTPPPQSLPAVAPGQILVLADTANQRRCVTPVLEHLPQAVHCSFREGSQVRLIYSPSNAAGRDYRWRILLAWLFSSGYARASIESLTASYRWACGHYAVFADWLRAVRPAAVMVANDHSNAYRALTLAAKSVGIPTIFLQHASTGAEPAPLHYDLVFLDSEKDLSCYAERERWMTGQSQVFVLGNPQHDAYHAVRQSFPDQRVLGICVKNEDELAAARELSSIAKSNGWNSLIRPHPKFAQKTLELLPDFPELTLASDSRSETTLDFLRRVTCVLSGVSSILRDAAIAGRPPLSYGPFLKESTSDWYGYHQEKLCHLIDNAGDLCAYLKTETPQFDAPAEAVRKFHAPFDTPWEGQSARIMASVITRFIAGQNPADGPEFDPHPKVGPLGKLRIHSLAATGGSGSDQP